MEKLAGDVLGLLTTEEDQTPGDITTELIDLILQLREEARQRRDWATADGIRDQLAALGIIIEDSPEGPRWKRQS